MEFRERLRKLVPGLATLTVVGSLFATVQVSVAVPDGAPVAAKYKFKEMKIAMPPGYERQRMNSVRKVNPAYEKIRSWVSSVGAGIAINDLTGHGVANGMCIVDTRTDQVVVTYTPTARQEDRFTPFVLNAAPLPMDDAMAPTGCTPGDYNADGRMDLLVSYWGRTPVLFMAKDGAAALAAGSYVPRELVPSESRDGKYHGPRWNTDAVHVGDLDGDGHPDIVVGNYFPDSDVLDPHGLNNVVMHDSMSSAKNAGGDHVLRWRAGTSGAQPDASYVEEKGAIPYEASTGWTLAISGADLTGDVLPELYVANDFGHDHLLYNKSKPGRIAFSIAKGQRTPTTPKSFVLGDGSFKGMGVDFGDLDGNGSFDMVVSNITVAWGLEESNFVWKNQAKGDRDMDRQLSQGVAPFTQEAQEHGMAWSGWGWDVKMADFLNSGDLSVVQTTGFVKGEIDRWPWLQETATMNDALMSNPKMWPNIQPGDDLAGDNTLAFFAKSSNGKYVNISEQLGLAVPTPTRALAMADTTGTGSLDFAVARQWGPPAFYVNQSPAKGSYLNLQMYRPAGGAAGSGAKQGAGAPAYGTKVTIETPDGKQVSQLDGGGGHSGFRSFDVHFGLGSHSGPVTAHLEWRDADGQVHRQTQKFNPGTHALMLTTHAQEIPTR
ncbi:CRTAC1 family protein [Streptomyces hydrogenans]|uniref:CRTAC1 family protein n=2 Tax=Streptomyces hydrogenans TaxID=1873719 RepID=UPI0036657623